MGPFGTIRDNFRSFGAIWDHFEPFWDHLGQFYTIRIHLRPFEERVKKDLEERDKKEIAERGVRELGESGEIV